MHVSWARHEVFDKAFDLVFAPMEGEIDIPEQSIAGWDDKVLCDTNSAE